MKNICLTFDYELFFGESGTIENCILKPTEDILNLFRKHNLVGTFFVDVLYLQRLKNIESESENYYKIINQLKEIVSLGSRIELHLHPHWLDATFDKGKWVFPHYNRYMLQSLSDAEIVELFVTNVNYLNSIANQVDQNYRVRVFRAGGWCVLPFDKLIKAFYESGIYIDSSVASGMFENHTRSYNFISAPTKTSWRFADNPIVENIQGNFIEIPITTYSRNVIDRLYKKIYFLLTNDSIYGDGKGIVDWFSKSRISKLKQILFSNLNMLSTDNIPFWEFKYKFNRINSDNIVIINHPKSMLKRSGLKNMEYLKNHRSMTIFDLANNI